MEDNLKKISNAFYGGFKTNHVILYVGQNASEADFNDEIANCPWSCVITTRKDAAFSSRFATAERQPKEICSVDELPSKPLDRKKLNILRLFGIEGEESDGLEWLTVGSDSEASGIENARELLKLVPGLLKGANTLVMTGIDSKLDWKLVGNPLTKILFTQAADGAVSIWGLPEVDSHPQQAYNILKKAAGEKSFGFYTDPLSSILRSPDAEDAAGEGGEDIPTGSGYDIYWQAGVPVSIEHEDLLQFKSVGILMTEQSVYKIRPLGRVEQQKWFFTFLETTSISTLGPQWYGYFPQSTFYVKRSYEDVLIQVVRRMLDGQGPAGGTAQNYPVILSGDPGSSKSVTLAALAYRIYSEKNNPVIFIPDESLIGNNLDDLNEAMRLLELRGKTETRTLVIWDCSTYRADRAKDVAERLDGMGRRFVLVCSSYAMRRPASGDEDGALYYRLDLEKKNKFERCGTRAEAQLIQQGNAYYVETTREMDEEGKEQYEFWMRIEAFSGIRPETVSYLRDKLEADGSHDIFNYYYQLISLLRNNLEKQLEVEQSKVYQYVNNKLGHIVGEINQQSWKQRVNSPVYQAFLKAGFSPDQVSLDGGDGEPNNLEDLFKRLDRFNICVAMFSRFKLDVPYNLAYDVLFSDDGAEEDGQKDGGGRGAKGAFKRFSEDDQALFSRVTREIPWIYYGETETGSFAFRFRSVREAEIYLRSNEITGEQQVELLCKILDIYQKDYQESRCLDPDFTSNLQMLLRLMGPNSVYPEFQSGSREYKSILEHLDRLIEKIRTMIDDQQRNPVPDLDAGFVSIIVTFTREFFGPVWKVLHPISTEFSDAPWEQDSEHYSQEKYLLRLNKMRETIQLAEKSIDQIDTRVISPLLSNSERNHLIRQKHSLIVETAQCSRWLEELLRDYESCCQARGSVPDNSLIAYQVPYRMLYRQLWGVISSNPTNGYAYNTLFRLFEQLYEDSALSKGQKLQYLSEIMQVVENCKALHSEIINRGSNDRDEIGDHITKITNYSADFQLTLSAIIRHREGKEPRNEGEALGFSLFNEMQAAQNPSAILLVCQKELRIPQNGQELNQDQLARCRRIHDFMMEEDNYACISSSAYALSTLIRVCWMLYNRTVLSPVLECQLTRLKPAEWKELNQLCSSYDRCTSSSGANNYGTQAVKQPIIMLLYALSTLHCNGLTDHGYRDALSILKQIDEDLFYQPRMRTPFMICDEKGMPVNYTGTVRSIEKNGGFINIHGLQTLNNRGGVRFRQRNLGRRESAHAPGDVFGKELELGIGYISFSVYKAAGRKEKEARQ